MPDFLSTMWEEKKYGQLVALVATIVVILGGTISFNLPYPKKADVKKSHIALVHNVNRDELIARLKDNRNWMSTYQSQIALLNELETTQAGGLTKSQRAVLDGLEREMSLIITGREELMQQLERGGYVHDPLYDDDQ